MIEKLNIYPDDWEKGYPRYIEQIEAKINEIIEYIEKLEKEKEKNKALETEYLIQRDLINADFLKDYIHKDKIQKIVDECIPKKENIFTGELEYTTNANANSFLAQEILNLLNKE